MSEREIEPKDECFICYRRRYGLEEIKLYYHLSDYQKNKSLYYILDELYGGKVENKTICNECILKTFQYNELKNINNKLEKDIKNI